MVIHRVIFLIISVGLKKKTLPPANSRVCCGKMHARSSLERLMWALVVFCFSKWQMHLTAVNPYFIVVDVFWPLLKGRGSPSHHCALALA